MGLIVCVCICVVVGVLVCVCCVSLVCKYVRGSVCLSVVTVSVCLCVCEYVSVSCTACVRVYIPTDWLEVTVVGIYLST